MAKKQSSYQIAALLALALCGPSIICAGAQDAPIPGAPSGAATAGSAPTPGTANLQTQRRAALPPGAAGASGSKGFGYGDLPLNADDAKAKVVELTNMSSTARPQELQERVDQLCAWLTDMVDAHNKMANAFSKHDQLKSQSTAERQSAQKFMRLKNQAMLLKADLLISMRRYPEALVPLIDIVIAEPTTETGKGAYKRLQDLGFSPDAAEVTEAKPSADSAEPAKSTADASGAKQKFVIVPNPAPPSPSTKRQPAYSSRR